MKKTITLIAFALIMGGFVAGISALALYSLRQGIVVGLIAFVSVLSLAIDKPTNKT